MTKSPHFWWLITILTLVIIALATFIITERMSDGETFMGYVSVCSILLSITLSIFAIQYTYTSNTEIHQQFEKINSVADGIKTASESLTTAGIHLTDELDKILKSLELISATQQTIQKQLEQFSNPTLGDDASNTVIKRTSRKTH